METEYTVLNFLDDHNDIEWRKKIEDLIKYFCNNVFLGQWELARCAVPILNESNDESSENIVKPAASPKNDDLGNKEIERNMNAKIFTNMLIDVTQYPFSQSLGSRSVPSPHHLSWLCILALNTGRSLKVSDELCKEVDFRLTLSSLQVNDVSLCQELYTCFKTSLQQAASYGLNAECSEVLKKTLQQSPALGDSLIRSLIGTSHSGPNSSNPSLQALYLESVSSLQDGEKVLEILSYYSPEPYLNYLQLRQLLTCLVTATLNHALPGVTVETLMSAMTGRSTFYLLEEFSQIFQEVSVVNQGKDDLKTEESFTLLSMTGVDRDKAWRDHLTFCSRKRLHFITDLLDLSLALVKGGKLPELQELLSYPELQPLKSLVLLMGWSHCLTTAQAQMLVDTLWDDQVDSYNQALGNSCRKLAQHLDLIHWCMDRAKPILPGVGVGAPVYGSQLLQGLETHSVLHVLHHSASLTSLHHAEVLQLLTNTSAEKRIEKKKKSVQFEDEQAVLCSVDVEQLKDVSTFRGYCAVKNVLDAAWFCGQQGDKLMNPVSIRRYSRHLDRAFEHQLSSSEGEDSCSPGGERHGSSPGVGGGEEFVQSYDLKVSKKLREAKEMLSLLQPLNYRVEILENIFSILFISYQDLMDEALDVELEEVVPDCTNTCSEEETRQTRATASSTQHPSSTSAARPFSLDYDIPFVDPPCGATPHMSPAHLAPPHSAVSPTPEQDVSPKSCKKKKRSPSTGPVLTGFVLNEYLVRDILHLLKDAISDLKSARILLTGTKKTGLDPVAEDLLTKSQGCSVQPEDLPKRLSKLTQAVHEAWWRFQLVSHEAIPRQAFHLLTERIYISDQELYVPPVCESRPTHSGADRQGTALASNIVEKMISSPQSLLVLTLMKGSPTQAAQVMKLFHVTEKSAETCEVSFGQEFHTCASKIWNLESEAREKALVGVGKRSMKALSKAASVGVATATLSNLVEELLARPSLPPVPRRQQLDVVSVQLLELLCCWSRSWESCSNMLDICKAKTTLLDTDPRRPPSEQLTSPTVGVKACLEFVWSLYELIHCTESGQDIQQLLHSALSTFSVPGLRDFAIASLETRRSVERVQAILSCQHHLDIPHDETAASPRGSASSLSGSDSSRSRCSVEVKLETDKNQLHAAIKQLMYTMEKFVPAVGLTQLLHSNKSPPTFKNYLLSLYKHAKEMTNLLAESEGLSQEVSSNYFQVLEEGPIKILGRLLFVRKMPPARLEPVAEKLSLNLTHTIVYTCCPKIPSRRHHWSDGQSGASNMSNGTTSNLSDGRTSIMSDGTTSIMSNGTVSTNVHPEKLVGHILKQLIKAMKSVTNESSAMFDLASARRLLTLECYADIVHQTSLLQVVDLTLLQSQQESLCFFVNLFNLMMLHCHLSHLTHQVPGEYLELSEHGAADNIAYLGSFSYSVGQMGLVSVLDLLSLICPETLQLSSHMTAARKMVSPGNDPLRKLCPVNDPWLMFVINMGCVSSPPLQVLVPDEVNLEKSLSTFLSQTVLISVEQERVVLPQLLQWNQSLLVPQDARPGPTSLLQWTLPFLPAGAQKQLEQLLKLDNSATT
ncbi:zinc finger FYVE domain-containing protein 26-like, partial [Physella acuta]|uniref:zinc finger FYVE domain-containing protein 26-like n=1 Tax=Physella acuta TaxID=109671 RepID=UPI0027DB3BDF